MKILIAVPTFENIAPDTFRSIYRLDTGSHDVDFDFIRGHDCATARNKIAKTAISRDVDYVFMVDGDVVLPEDALMNLLHNAKDVCLGYYAHRNEDNIYNGNMCICKLFDSAGHRYFNYPFESEYTAEEMEELRANGVTKMLIHGGGMGCALIRTDVFKRLSYPWFDWVNYKGGKMLSEDLFFCEQCRMNHIPIFTDVRVACGHIFRYIQNPEVANH